MTKISTLVVCFAASICFSQVDHDFFDKVNLDFQFVEETYVENGDTTELSMSIRGSSGSYHMSECFEMHDRWHWWDMSDNPDSLLKHVRNILLPHLGKSSQRVVVEQYNDYNTEDIDLSTLDEEEKSWYKKDCFRMAYSYECWIMLRDSIWFPFEFSIDSRNHVLSMSTIPKCLKNAENWNILNLKKVYRIAKRDPYLKEAKIRPFISLEYSKGMDLFYFELEADDGEVIVEKKTNHSTYSETMVKHMYIDAVTGKILWRIKCKHIYDAGGCVINSIIEIPSSPLTGY